MSFKNAHETLTSSCQVRQWKVMKIYCFGVDGAHGWCSNLCEEENLIQWGFLVIECVQLSVTTNKKYKNKERLVNMRENTLNKGGTTGGEWCKTKYKEKRGVQTGSETETQTKQQINRKKLWFRRRRCWSGWVEAKQQWWIVFTPLSVPTFLLLSLLLFLPRSFMSSPPSPLFSHPFFCFALLATCLHRYSIIGSSLLLFSPCC